MSFQIFQDSRLGRRKNNEDRIGYCYSKNCVLLVAADGMGGYEYGEVASQLALQTLSDLFRKKVQKGIKDPKSFLIDSILQAHETITDYALKRHIDFPRTTIVLCLISKNTAYWAHAGDSRLYVIRNGQIFQKTHDHCRVNDLLEAGKITAEEAHVHPERNKIYSCLGGTVTPIISVSQPLKMKDGDIILLATDGLWGNVKESTLINSFNHVPFKEAMSNLLDKAEEGGGKFCDNLSTVALMWENEPTADSITPEDLAKNEIKTDIAAVVMDEKSAAVVASPAVQAPSKEETSPVAAKPIENKPTKPNAVAVEPAQVDLSKEIESAIADVRAIIAKVAPDAQKHQNRSLSNPDEFNFPR